MTDVTNPDDEDVRSPAHPGPPAAKDPDEWVTGEEPTTGPQQSYLGTLARVPDESVPTDLTKAQASERIEELQRRTGRDRNRADEGT